MFCVNCGSKLEEGDAFCYNCGAKNENIVVSNDLKEEREIEDLSTQIRKGRCVNEYPKDTNYLDLYSVKFGKYPQSDPKGKKMEDIEWIILEKREDKALLLSKFVLDCKKMYYEYFVCDETDPRPFKNSTWEDSELRKWLNKDFLNIAFDKNSQAFIIESRIDNFVKRGDRWAKNEMEKTKDKIFCLDTDECIKYFEFNYTDNPRKKFVTSVTNYAIANGAKDDYWQRDGYEPDGNGNFVFKMSRINGTCEWRGHCDKENIGVRPAIWVKYN